MELNMRRVIGGKVYNTETATCICCLPCFTQDERNFNWHDTHLYKTPKGAYFISGEGGPRSMWAEQIEAHGWAYGSGLTLVTEEEARSYAEQARVRPDEYEAAFGPVEVG